MPDPYKKTYTKKLRNPYEDRPNLHRYGTRYIREAHELHHPGMLRHYPDITAHERFLRKHARETKKGKGGTRRRRHTRRR